MIVVDAIGKVIDGKRVLEGVSFRLGEGKATGIIGPNGAGKSVLLRAVALTDPPSCGQVVVGNRKYTFPAVKQRPVCGPWPELTLVSQHLFLFPHLTLLQNLMLALKRERRLDVAGEGGALLNEFGLVHLLKRYPNQMSLGERQRAAFVRAMLLRPKWLLLDEPTSAVDVEGAEVFLRYLETAKTQGTAILIATHMLGLCRRLCDDVMFLDRGKVVEAGPVTILRSPETRRLTRFMSLVGA